jgi:hypothetical protein
MSVSRDGEPKLIRGPQTGSLQLQNKYTIRTSALPPGPRGEDWRQCFNSRFPQHHPIAVNHDGNEITAECWPDDKSKMVEEVDSAIEYANESFPN